MYKCHQCLWVLEKPPNLLSILPNSNFHHLFVFFFYFHSWARDDYTNWIIFPIEHLFVSRWPTQQAKCFVLPCLPQDFPFISGHSLDQTQFHTALNSLSVVCEKHDIHVFSLLLTRVLSNLPLVLSTPTWITSKINTKPTHS